MAEIGKPIGRGPGLATPQPASGNRRGAATARRGAVPQRPTDGHTSAEHSEDTLEAEHGHLPERAAHKPEGAVPRGYQAGLARPTGPSARPPLGGQRLPPRAAGTMPAVGSLSLQGNKEHGPMVFAAALSHLNMLAGSAALTGGASHQQEALRDMSRLLQQAHLQHGFTEADAEHFVSLAQAAGLADQKKLMAAAQVVRPASPGSTLKDNPYATLDAIHEEREAKAAPSAAQAALDEEVRKAQLAEQESLARSKDSAARMERVEQKLASRSQEIQADTQEARLRARRLARPEVSIGAKLAHERAVTEQQQASARGHTVPHEALAPDEASLKKSGPR